MRPAAGAAPLDEAPGKAIDARIAAAVEPLATLAERAKDGLRPESARQILNPAARIASLKAALASLAIGSEDRPGAAGRSLEVLRELGDRIERRIILSERQLAAADARPERGEASGLDYQGKVRIVEHALHSVGDRLEVSYRLPGADPVRALLRPVRLDKTDKGLVLEAEDLATGGPTRVPLGAMSSVKRMRASLFGEET